MKQQRLSRRQLLLGVGSVALATTLPSWGSAASAWVPSLQLYTLRDAIATDFVGTLRQVAAIGYRAVEPAGRYGRSAAELRSVLDGLELACPSVHVVAKPRPDAWHLQGDLTQLVSDLKTLGAGYAVLAAPLEPQAELFEAADWLRTAELLNDKAQVLADAGLRIAYHNHASEFAALSAGKTGFQLLLENTDPALVDFQLDIGWATAAGQNIGQLFQIAQGRIKLLHLKDTQQRSTHPNEMIPANIGSGIVDWRELVALIRRAGVRYAYVEQEAPFPGPPLDSVRIAYEYLTAAFAKSTQPEPSVGCSR